MPHGDGTGSGATSSMTLRAMVVTLLLLAAACLLFSSAGCSTLPEGPESRLGQPQWRPCWARDGKWDPHWVKNEPCRPWPL
jgi:hypothetical protein